MIAGLYPFSYHSPLITYAVSNMAVALCLIHCSMWAGRPTTIKIFLVTWLTGYFTEVLGVNFQFLYGLYYYPEGLSGPLVLGVPPMAMLIYFPLGYTCFIMGRAVIGGLSTRVTGLRLIGVAIFAALAMTTHDFSNDPFQSTVRGLWVWPNGGAYFGVPLQNFIGWFVLTSFFTALVGLIANSAKAMEFISKPKTPNFFLLPILLYLIFEVPQMLRPILLDPSPINLAGSGIAMFATTIPVVAALLVLYGQHSSQDSH
ncbi:carotenoid biosynthesis protein [Polynucleobacter paneuropaeus]|nr:carotenoid biosynthesis protein [Polynucleobacter paneuropaeus]